MVQKDMLTAIAIFVGLTIIVIAIAIGGSLRAFWSISSLLITILGSFCALMVKYPLSYIKEIPQIIRNVFLQKKVDTQELVESFYNMSRKSRKEGLLVLEEEIAKFDDFFLKKGIQMVVDGVEPETIEKILNVEMQAMEDRHRKRWEIFETWGEYAPAFGMIGTLIGLIQMLSQMNNAETLASGMATALITTFYGALFANLVLLPIAGKLHLQSKEELENRELVLEGILAIQSGVNPRFVQERLKSYLPPLTREAVQMSVEGERMKGSG